jgi:hypothetical protein
LRRLLFPVLLVFFLVQGSAVVAQAKSDGAAAGAPVSQAPYRVGERLTYDVTFSSFINAAHVEIFVAARGNYFNREGIQLRGHVETTGIVNATLFAVNNDYTSYIDAQSGQPYRSQQVVREGGRTSDTSNDYNLPLGTDALPARRTDAFVGTYDFLSGIYRLRALPLAVGSTYKFSARSEATQYDAELKVLCREMVKTNVGSFNTLVTQVKARGNSNVNDRKIRIYFSDDDRHVPVLITLEASGGTIRADLAGSEFVEPPAAQPGRKPSNTQPVAGLNPDPTSSSSASGLPFAVGEQLNYNIYLGTATQAVAVASAQVKSRGKYFDKDGFLMTVSARTNGPLAKLFTANDQINTYVDPSTLVPFRTELQLQEGKRRVNEVVTIDQDRGTALTDKGKRIEIPVGTHDLLSVLYALRAFNLSPPKRNAVSLLVNGRPLTLFVTSLKREKIQINGQSIATIQLSLTTDDPQGDKFGLRMWVGDDRRRVPLRVTANTELGQVRADLAIIPIAQQ